MNLEFTKCSCCHHAWLLKEEISYMDVGDFIYFVKMGGVITMDAIPNNHNSS
jgi:hypothetical protein